MLGCMGIEEGPAIAFSGGGAGAADTEGGGGVTEGSSEWPR